MANLTSYLSLTASSLGNHEFDDGLGDLKLFAESVPYPLLACNVDIKQDDLKKLIQPYTVLTINNKGHSKKVAILGYVTTDTEQTSIGGKESFFEEEVSALHRTIKELKEKNAADIYVGVGHSGYLKDLEIAKKVS